VIYKYSIREANAPPSHPNHIETTITIQDGTSNQDPVGQDLFPSLLPPRRRRPKGISSSPRYRKIPHRRYTFYNEFTDYVHDREVLRTSVMKEPIKEVLFARPLSVVLLPLSSNDDTQYCMLLFCAVTAMNGVLIEFSCKYIHML
jgi:hypothetical protein